MLTIKRCRKIIESLRAVERLRGERAVWERQEAERYEKLVTVCLLLGMSDMEEIDEAAMTAHASGLDP
ncbi:hypothetical protein [Rhizobium sp. S163]|uniref:hypothetical protein n=1 Tax=Rhizobium sp. S163 TaxID=3055039 RepID=UPI0025A98802|nr:hypothetical protein [Rhizobium sp. S163]MDM9645522.1 hypothetical protein [Rhizobium sp. S163]